MSQKVEWARAGAQVSIEDDPDWEDPHGSKINKGNIGVWLNSVLIEGTSEEFRDLAKRLAALVATSDDGPAAVEQLLGELIERGLTFGQVIGAFAAQQGPEEQAYVEAAREQWQREGEIEIDDKAIVSGSDDRGDYVMAWVWVADPDNTDEEDT